MVNVLPSRHEVIVRFRLWPLSAHDEDGDIGGEAGQASGKPRDILRDVGDVTTVPTLPSLEAVDAHDGGDLGNEHLHNLRHTLQLWGYISRVHVVVGGEGFGVLLVAVAAFAPVCLQKSKVQEDKSAQHHVVLAPWCSGSVCTFESSNPLEVSSSPSVSFVLFLKKQSPPLFFFFPPPPPPLPKTLTFEIRTMRSRWARTCYRWFGGMVLMHVCSKKSYTCTDVPRVVMSKYGRAFDGWDIFFKGAICRTLKRLKLINEPVAVACVYACMCARPLSCMVVTYL